tara:strand:+ start:209069 stop:209842 length:774 start_codon:yes stop_codon:yes gene_type:complete
MEKDDEIKGFGNSYTAQFWQSDLRLGRWLSLDPLSSSFSWQSPYAAFDNNPIKFTDPRGLAAGDPKVKKGSSFKDSNGNTHNTSIASVDIVGKRSSPSLIDKMVSGIRKFDETIMGDDVQHSGLDIEGSGSGWLKKSSMFSGVYRAISKEFVDLLLRMKKGIKKPSAKSAATPNKFDNKTLWSDKGLEELNSNVNEKKSRSAKPITTTPTAADIKNDSLFIKYASRTSLTDVGYINIKASDTTEMKKEYIVTPLISH